AREPDITRCRTVHLAEIPVEEPVAERPAMRQPWMAQIAARCNLPGDVGDCTRLRIEPGCQFLGAFRKTITQRERLQGGRRHALAVTWIEAAKGIADHEIARGQARQTLVAPAPAGR